MQGQGYRPDIDGLRAVAVLAVVFYHVGYMAFSGGYVGVDVFFVISGFLITRMIYAEVQTGNFRFSVFYARRARRLFPALFVTLVATFLCGVFVLSPSLLEGLSKSVVFTVLSVSNFLFWRESGYFDTEADLKPLLHTWSLSVEEQFYLVWPITLIMLVWFARRMNWGRGGAGGYFIAGFLFVAGTASVVFAELVLRTDAAAVFFLAPFRISEFAIGGIMVWAVTRQPSNKLILDALMLVGFALVAYPIFAYTPETVFPGLAALPPCIGTAILIYAGAGSRLNGVLNNPVAVGIGLISYSLYLVHWPIYVYYHYWVLRALSPMEQSAVVLLSVAIAAAMYRWVERPFRRAAGRPYAWTPARVGQICVSLSAVLIVVAGTGWSENGWPTRLPADLRATVGDPAAKRLLTQLAMKKLTKKRHFEDGRSNVFVIGDSHAKDFANALVAADKRLGEKLDIALGVVSYLCQPYVGGRPASSELPVFRGNHCNVVMNRLLDSDLLREADIVVLSARWRDDGVANVEDTIKRIEAKTDARVMVVGRTAEFYDVPELLLRYGRYEGFGEYVLRTRADVSDLDEQLKSAVLEAGATFLPRGVLVCPQQDACDILDGRNNLLIYDYGHWTLEGADFYGNRMVDTGYLDFLKP